MFQPIRSRQPQWTRINQPCHAANLLTNPYHQSRGNISHRPGSASETGKPTSMEFPLSLYPFYGYSESVI